MFTNPVSDSSAAFPALREMVGSRPVLSLHPRLSRAGSQVAGLLPVGKRVITNLARLNYAQPLITTGTTLVRNLEKECSQDTGRHELSNLQRRLDFLLSR